MRDNRRTLAPEFLLREFSTSPRPSRPQNHGKMQKEIAASGHIGSARARRGDRGRSAAATRWDRGDRREGSTWRGISGKLSPAELFLRACAPGYSARAGSNHRVQCRELFFFWRSLAKPYRK